MKASNFNNIEVNNNIERFINKSFDISDEISLLLEQKGLNQKQISELLHKKESQISKWLTGTHNFTLKTIADIEAVLGEDIILVVSKAKERFTKINMEISNSVKNQDSLTSGDQEAITINYQSFKENSKPEDLIGDQINSSNFEIQLDNKNT